MGASRALTDSGNRSSHPSTGSAKPTLAIVIPICNESAGLEELFRRLRSLLDGLTDLESRVIYVNDGSSDGSLEMMLDPRALSSVCAVGSGRTRGGLLSLRRSIAVHDLRLPRS